MVFASQKVLECSPQSPAVFWAIGCCFRKGSLHLSPKWLLVHKGSLEGSANCALHLSPSLLPGSKLRELLTCLTHTNPGCRKPPIMSLLLGYSLGFFCIVEHQDHLSNSISFAQEVGVATHGGLDV